jgi:hypothetical protein
MGFHNPRIETRESIIKYGIKKKSGMNIIL